MNRADYNVGNLESEIKVQFEQAVSALDQTTTALGEVTSKLKDVISQLNELKGNTGLQNIANQTEDLKKKLSLTDKFLKFSKAVKSTIKLGAIFATLKQGWNAVKDITSASIDMIETTNLFEVQMSKVVDEYGNLDEAQSTYYTKAMAFQDKMNEKLATNKAEMQKYQAMYYGMLNSQLGSKNRDASYLMSESLTKAGYDIASLYNLDVETAMNKLKSGLAGQIESLRQIGIDVSEASLSRILDRVGIDRSVQQLSYAEKEVARYIAICEQAGKAQGDFARTFEQPANQIRVFKNQIMELKQVAGSFFVGLFGQIMPVINGIIMAIKEVLKALGSVFGFEVDVGNSSLGAVSDTVGDIGTGIGSATKKAKEFKKQLMGFDEINNITPPSENKGGSGGGSVNGIDNALLNALKEWDNKMDSISGKAQEIRDKILDWLGVTDGSYTNLKRIWEIVRDIGAGLLAWKFSKGFLTLLQKMDLLKNLNAFQMSFGIGLSITGIWLMWNGTKKLLNGDVNLFSILETIGGMGATTFGIANILKSINNGQTFSWGKSLVIGFGVTLSIQGFEILIEGIKNKDIGKAILGAVEGAIGVATVAKTLSSVFKGSKTIKTVIDANKQISGLAKSVSASASSFKLPKVTTILKGLADLAIIVGGVTVLITAIGGFMTIPGIKEVTKTGIGMLKEVFLGITSIALPLIGVATAINVMGGIGVTTFVKGLTDFGIIIGGISTLIGILGALVSIPYISDFISTGIDTIQNVFKGIGSVGTELGVTALALVAMGLANPATLLSGLAGFAIVIDGVSLVIASLGALSQIPGFTWLVGEGGELLYQVAEILGGFAGSIIRGFVDKTFEGLEDIGTHLSNFITNAQPFFDGVQNINAESVEAVKSLAETVLILTAQNILDGLTSWFAGETSLETFGKEIASFAPYYKKYAKTIQGIDFAVVQNSAIAAKALAEFANNVPNEKGVVAWIIGDNTLDKFSEKLPEFGKNLKQYADNVRGLDNGVVENSVKSAQSIVEISKNIPNQGGIISWFTGDNKINDFSKPLPEFGKNLKQYGDNVSGLDSSIVENSAKAAESIVEFSKKIPNSGGIVAWFTGDNTIDKFGEKLAKFGKEFKNYYNYIKEMSIDKVNSTTSAITDITNQLVRVKDNNLSDTAKNYGEAIKEMGKKIKDGLKDSITVNYKDMLNIGKNIGQGLIDGMNNKSWSVSNTAKTIAQNIVTQFKNKLQIHSPSKIMENLSKFIPLGIAKGIDDEADTVYNSISELNKGIKINTSDFAVDTNQYVNYSAIKGQILAQSQISMNDNIADRIAEAVAQSMRNAEVNVNIEAKTEKGIMLKKVQEEAKEYTMQTGEPAFNY